MRFRTVRPATGLACVALAWLCGCASAPTTGDRPVVAVSVLPQAWFVEHLAGEFADVEVMIPPGANPATHEPTVGQMRAVSRAVAYVEVGHPHFPFEKAWLERLVRGNDTILRIDGSAGAAAGDDDPHLWLSPEHAATMARNIESGLARSFPGNDRILRANLDGLLAEIDRVDAEVRSLLAPYAGRRFLVFHPAWGYFADAYGLEQVAIEHHGKEPSPAELGALLQRARDERIRVVLVQPQFSRAEAEVVARETGARVEVLDPLGRDWAATMLATAEVLVRSFER